MALTLIDTERATLVLINLVILNFNKRMTFISYYTKGIATYCLFVWERDWLLVGP
jgi:hypothetical protein